MYKVGGGGGTVYSTDLKSVPYAALSTALQIVLQSEYCMSHKLCTLQYHRVGDSISRDGPDVI